VRLLPLLPHLSSCLRRFSAAHHVAVLCLRRLPDLVAIPELLAPAVVLGASVLMHMAVAFPLFWGCRLGGRQGYPCRHQDQQSDDCVCR